MYLSSWYDVGGLNLVVESTSGGLVNRYTPIMKSEKSAFFFRCGCKNALRIILIWRIITVTVFIINTKYFDISFDLDPTAPYSLGVKISWTINDDMSLVTPPVFDA